MTTPSPSRHVLVILASLVGSALSFAPSTLHYRRHSAQIRPVVLSAGGFEWEDPTSDQADPGVDNPYKNPALLTDGPDELKVDTARLLAPRLQGCNVYLIGLMGSGKSAVGDALARRMGTYNFLDTDAVLERAANMTIPDMFAAEGEEAFRDAEARVLDGVHAHVRCVIGTGGGLVVRNQNWSKLQTGLVVYLEVTPELVMARLAGGTDRPLLQTDDPLATLGDLLAARRERYEQADVTVPVTEGMDVQAVADQCVRALHDFIDDNPPAWKQAKAKAQADGLDWVN